MTTTEPETTQAPSATTESAVPRWWSSPAVFAASFGALFTLLLIRNRWLFSDRVHEAGDMAANSIITGQAKDFELLVGNYSRLRFSHPGPAFFYVQGFGEWLMHDLLGVVPTPWNGQAIAILALNSALLALVLTILYSWFRSVGVVALCGGALLAYLAGQELLVSSTWMPYVYFAPFVLLLAAGASVAAGRSRHVWMLALAGGFLVHGHASFLLLFVPVIAGTALLVLLWPHRRALWTFVSSTRRDWLLAAGVTAVFLLPMVLNLILHWPGDYWNYIDYGSSDSASMHAPDDAAAFVLRYWNAPAWQGGVLALVGFAAAGLLAWRAPMARRFLAAGVAAGALASLLVFGYATKGIDDLEWRYVAYFYWSVPLLVLLLIGGGAVAWIGAHGLRVVGLVAGGLAVVVGLVAAGRSSALITTVHADSRLPQAVDAMADRANGDPVTLELVTTAPWPAAAGVIVESSRRDVRVCIVGQEWEFLMTSEFVCTEEELDDGHRLMMNAGKQPPDGAVTVARLDGAVVSDPR